MEVLKCENLKKYYGNHENTVKALDGVDLSVEKGEFVAIVGSFRFWKSTWQETFLMIRTVRRDRPSLSICRYGKSVRGRAD